MCIRDRSRRMGGDHAEGPPLALDHGVHAADHALGEQRRGVESFLRAKVLRNDWFVRLERVAGLRPGPGRQARTPYTAISDVGDDVEHVLVLTQLEHDAKLYVEGAGNGGHDLAQERLHVVLAQCNLAETRDGFVLTSMQGELLIDPLAPCQVVEQALHLRYRPTGVARRGRLDS